MVFRGVRSLSRRVDRFIAAYIIKCSDPKTKLILPFSFPPPLMGGLVLVTESTGFGESIRILCKADS